MKVSLIFEWITVDGELMVSGYQGTDASMITPKWNELVAACQSLGVRAHQMYVIPEEDPHTRPVFRRHQDKE